MRTNTRRPAAPPIYTHEGGAAARISPEAALRRSVLSCMLWEDEFYEDGASIADRIAERAAEVSRETVSALAIEARNVHGLRHVPLILLLDLIKRGGAGVADVVDQTLRRADEMSELVAIYWKGGRKMLPRQMRLGLAKALNRFGEYALQKYDRGDSKVRLKDVLFMARAKPKDDYRTGLFKRLAESELVVADTWETRLSKSEVEGVKKDASDKKAAFEDMIRAGKLGYLALLRNLRNMLEAGCDLELIREAILARKGAELVFPFRYVAAARAAPQLEPWIDRALCASVAEAPQLAGRTVVLVDVSQSMMSQISKKSDLTRLDAAAALASLVNCEKLRVFSFSEHLAEVPPRRGMSGVDAIRNSQRHGGTWLFDAVKSINDQIEYDRLIVITDEQAHGPNPGFVQGTVPRMPDPTARGYLINVASAQNGVGYGAWTHIDGFSEATIRFIVDAEAAEIAQAADAAAGSALADA